MGVADRAHGSSFPQAPHARRERQRRQEGKGLAKGKREAKAAEKEKRKNVSSPIKESALQQTIAFVKQKESGRLRLFLLRCPW